MPFGRQAPWPPTPAGRRRRRGSTTRSPGLTPLLTPTRSPSRAAISTKPPREALAADLHEHVRTAGFHQHRRLRHRRHPFCAGGVEDGRAGLADQQLAAWIVDLHLQRRAPWSSGRARRGRGRDGTSAAADRDGPESRAPRRSALARRAASAAGTSALSSTASVRDDLEERRAFVVRGAERRHHLDDPSGDRRAQDEGIAGRGAAAAPQRLVALGEPRFRRAQTRLRDRRRPAARLRPAAPARPARPAGVRRASCSARAASSAAWPSATSDGERRAIVAGRQPRLQAAEGLARP